MHPRDHTEGLGPAMLAAGLELLHEWPALSRPDRGAAARQYCVACAAVAHLYSVAEAEAINRQVLEPLVQLKLRDTLQRELEWMERN